MEKFNIQLHDYCEKRISEFDLIEAERKKQLEDIAIYILSKQNADQECNLNFICTHNSRRSHLGQIWSQTAAYWYGVERVETFSGGTEATAVNIRAVAALIRAGFIIENLNDVTVENPKYLVKSGPDAKVESLFSKVYDHPVNPLKDFIAILLCSDADKNCPVIPGADRRFYLPYDDPKMFDNIKKESEKYDESCQHIAREMLYLFNNVNMSL